MPARAMRPIRQFQRRSSRVKTAVVMRPLRMFTSTMGTMLSMLPTTVVQTPETCPRLLALKKPMGTLFIRSAMAMRRSAAMK